MFVVLFVPLVIISPYDASLTAAVAEGVEVFKCWSSPDHSEPVASYYQLNDNNDFVRCFSLPALSHADFLASQQRSPIVALFLELNDTRSLHQRLSQIQLDLLVLEMPPIAPIVEQSASSRLHPILSSIKNIMVIIRNTELYNG